MNKHLIRISMTMLTAWLAQGLALADIAEINPSLAPVITPGTSPIVHQTYFRGERYLFSYNPRFMPGPVCFDEKTRPYIRASVDLTGRGIVDGDSTCANTVVQTLDDTGNWIILDNITPVIKAAFPNWDGTFRWGPCIDERIVFDSAGDAYTILNTVYAAGIGYDLLLHSKDKCRSWTAYALSGTYHRLEMQDTNNDMSLPPSITTWASYAGSNYLWLASPTKKVDGTLDHTDELITITSSCLQWGATAGEGLFNCAVTKNNLTHVVYMGPTASDNTTSEYIATVNRTTRQLVAGPILLGNSGSLPPYPPLSPSPDNHNSPAITIDSQGYLHVVWAAHNYYFTYTKSNVANSITGGWSNPVHIDGSNNAGWTYPSLVCDPSNTLHLIGRYCNVGNSSDYYFRLSYLRKKTTDSAWVRQGTLVMPFKMYYSIWYHLPSIDRQGRLFLSYFYRGEQLDYDPGYQGQAAAYKAKWPLEIIQKDPNVNGGWFGLHAHEPCLLMSDNGGDTWRLALTTSLQQPFFMTGFENTMDGWSLYTQTGTTPITTTSSYTYNGSTIYPRSGGAMAVAAASYYAKYASKTVSPSQAGIFTGYINLLDNTTYNGVFEVDVPSHYMIVMTNHSANPGKVSYFIDSALTHTSIPATKLTWHKVRFVTGSGGTSAYWDNTTLFTGGPGTTVSRILFGTNWSTAPAGYDDFSFVPSGTAVGAISPGGYTGTLKDTGLRVQIRSGSTVIRTDRVFLNGDGKFAVFNVGSGCNVAIKGTSWLQKVISSTDVDITRNADLGLFSMYYGDCNGDNQVTSADSSIVTSHYGSGDP